MKEGSASEGKTRKKYDGHGSLLAKVVVSSAPLLNFATPPLWNVKFNPLKSVEKNEMKSLVVLVGLARGFVLSPTTTTPTRVWSSEKEEIDIRDARAQLLAWEKSGLDRPAPRRQREWAYETDLLEQGSVLLGKNEHYGFAMQQQHFHKAVMIVVQHDKNFTLGLTQCRKQYYKSINFLVFWFSDFFPFNFLSK